MARGELLITCWLVRLLMYPSTDWTKCVCIWWCAWKAQYILNINTWKCKGSLNLYYGTDFRLLWSQLVFLSVFRADKTNRRYWNSYLKILVRDKPFALCRGWKEHITWTLKICKEFFSSLSVNSHCTQCIPTVYSFLSPVIGIHCGSDRNEFKGDLCGHHICFSRHSIVMHHYYNAKITRYQLTGFYGETSPAA